MSETPEDKATNPGSEASLKDEEGSPKKFDIRDHNSEDLNNNEKLEAVFKELQVQREKIEKLENSNGNGFDLSKLNSFTVMEDGSPTEDAEKFRIEVIKQGKQGFTTSDIEGELGVSNPTASSKMKQMAEAFEDLEVYNPRENKQKPRYNQPKRLRHKGVARDKTVQEVLREEKDSEMLECPDCPEQVGVTNSRKVWREKLNWECPNCGSNIKDSF